MLNFSGNRHIFLARSPIDMRKGVVTLAGIVDHELGMNAFAGDIFIFIGKRANRVKILAWDQRGTWLLPRSGWNKGDSCDSS